MTTSQSQRGFTLIELLVTISMLSIVLLGFYQILFSGTRGSDTARSVVRISEEARQGLNRMTRDAREAFSISRATSTSYRIEVDFNGNGTIENTTGNIELLDYSFDSTARAVKLNGQLLISGVEQIPGEPVFSYSSNFLEYDTIAVDGVTDAAEIDAAPGFGNKNGVIDIATEHELISNIGFGFRIKNDDRETDFFAEVQMRNKR